MHPFQRPATYQDGDMADESRTSCHPELESLLGPYALAVLGACERRSIERHLAVCRPCVKTVRDYAAVVTALESALARRVPPRRLLARILERVAALDGR